ncbi:MAG: response regulator transcription factor [Bdellovibrionales bacterium]|nr:response regulator transcription factor [Bdellovibrionales bacterium]
MINVIVADDHKVLRQALCEMLRTKGTYNVVAEANNGEELLGLLQNHHPDLVILDMAMPKMDGISTLEQLAQKGTFPPVLVLSANEGERNVRAALKAGAKGYLPKNCGIEELEFAIDSILSGKTYLSPGVIAPLMSGSQAEHALENPLAVLTKREVEILRHLADGKPNREIAKMLHISTRTVDTHRSNILKKLNVKTNAELVKLAIANGVISV